MFLDLRGIKCRMMQKLRDQIKRIRRSEHIVKIRGSERDYTILAVKYTLEIHLEVLGTNEITLLKL